MSCKRAAVAGVALPARFWTHVLRGGPENLSPWRFAVSSHGLREAVGTVAISAEYSRGLVYPDHTPLTNLQLTLLNLLGVPTEKIGDSTGQFKERSEVGV